MPQILIADKSISTHTLRKEGDELFSRIAIHLLIFQPTPSARRVTICNISIPPRRQQFQPTPSARRVTNSTSHGSSMPKFQPTPSARRVTTAARADSAARQTFQPTPSARRVTSSV